MPDAMRTAPPGIKVALAIGLGFSTAGMWALLPVACAWGGGLVTCSAWVVGQERWSLVAFGETGGGQEMLYRAMILSAILLGCLQIAGCQTVETMDQALYNSCVDPYNQGFRSKPGFRSMVTGSGYGSTSCFWVWGKATQQQADDQAFVNCRKEKGFAICSRPPMA